ncbi:pseudouridine synthase [Methylobacterium nodulans]|uniref:Pseudouridine synthase n=1 Tax=Methylobacterium nodulans (strain LMG 21967 / CNCM I-2342 / ORS 2060) TaxID=460265 RepID=B8IDJ4_METNO|nr:pseudouridine synthase [Methylobacterium nodulans]ACL61360.1 RNA-binding S4 domain protein [Methylobacterium nodulans ORS 2060]
MSDSNDHEPRGPRRRRGTGEPDPAPAPAPAPSEPERIAKVIARAGIASRRDAEAMILEGRVTLNGETLTSPAVNVGPNDRITVDGEPLPVRERTRLWIFHKPRGVVTTARDPEGRQTVFEILPEDLPRVVAVGRLDINTEGLLLLTNDGGLAKVIAHPETGWLRRYRVRAYGDIDQAQLDRLRDGVTIDGMEYGPIEASIDRQQGDNVWLTLGLREGKNREVKRILEHLGLSVNRLIRLSFGPFQLGDLEVGLVEEVRTKVLKEQLGTALAEQAGVDFTSPVREPIAPFGSPKGARKTAAATAQAPQGRGEGRPARGERPAWGERPMWGERPARGGRDPARPQFGRAPGPGTRPERSRTPEAGPAPRRMVWRDPEAEAASEARPRVRRRSSDPKEARAAAAERPRERVGAIASGERRVVVERLVAEPAPEPSRPPRPEGRLRPEGRPRPEGRHRPEGRQEGERPARAERPDRAPRAREERPARRPYAEGAAPERRGPKGGFGGGPPGSGKGGFGKGGFAKSGGRSGPGKPAGKGGARPGGAPGGRGRAGPSAGAGRPGGGPPRGGPPRGGRPPRGH